MIDPPFSRFLFSEIKEVTGDHIYLESGEKNAEAVQCCASPKTVEQKVPRDGAFWSAVRTFGTILSNCQMKSTPHILKMY